eukprot:6190565-Pleurochrysis_carterae.AAC.2
MRAGTSAVRLAQVLAASKHLRIEHLSTMSGFAATSSVLGNHVLSSLPLIRGFATRRRKAPRPKEIKWQPRPGVDLPGPSQAQDQQTTFAPTMTNRERAIAFVAVVSSTLAIAMFTANKWEVERRLKNLPEEEREAWYAEIALATHCAFMYPDIATLHRKNGFQQDAMTVYKSCTMFACVMPSFDRWLPSSSTVPAVVCAHAFKKVTEKRIFCVAAGVRTCTLSNVLRYI